MDLTVLVKAIPDRDALRYDPDRRTVVRSGVPTFLNPFDQRALRVALDLRRPGEKIHLLSMGPPEIAPLLAETYALGIDRIVLVTDELLVGSDAFVTAKVLARATQRFGPTIVLTGDRSTDGESGILPAALAPLLFTPVITRARSIVRSESGFEFDVTADTEDGWARYRVTAPCLISVGEKIAKPKKATPAEAMEASARPIERWTASGLGFQPSAIGERGSLTTITHVTADAPTRSPQVYSGATLADGLAAARTFLRDAGVPAPSDALPPVAEGEAYDRELLVLASGPDGKLEPAALAILSELRRQVPDHWPTAVWVGPHPTLEEQTRLARAGAVRGYGLHGAVDPVLSLVATLGVERAIDRRPHAAGVILPSSIFGRAVAGRLATRRTLGVVTDAEEVHAGPAGQLLWTKPSFAGAHRASVVTHGRPSVVTFRPRRSESTGPASPERLDWIDIPFEPPRAPIERLEVGTERGPQFGDPDRARTVVGVGMGIGGAEALQRLLPDLAARGIALVASRRVVDAGWAPPHVQVGLTGRSIAPALGLLIGTSGSPNFMVGWRRAGRLLAINREPSAAVFRGVDLGLVGSWEEIVPALLAELPRSPTPS